jgi:ABC-type transporter Mla subunit MlaD
MTGMEWILDAVLVVLLAATLFHALRLERALGVLKRDRAALEDLVSSFNVSTRQAEAGIDQLRSAADGAGRQMARQIDTVTRLKDDLVFLLERGESLADRLESLVRAGRPLAADALRPIQVQDEEPADLPRVRSQAERDLLKALRMAR